MIGGDLLLTRIGHRLNAVRLQSCYVDREKINPCHAIYLRFDDWFAVQADAGRTEILKVEEPALSPFNAEAGLTQYPVEKLQAAAIGQRLASIAELKWRGDSFGVVLDFDGGAVLGIESRYPDAEAAEMIARYIDSRLRLPADLEEVRLG